MTDNSASCPTPDQLQALIDSALPADQLQSLQSHVDHCLACQRTLESMVAGSESWDAAAAILRDEPPSSQDVVFTDAMRRMKTAEFIDDNRDQGTDRTNPLSFLETSDQPGSIGRLGTYEITQLIGQGGMGVVLKAFDPVLHRVVAVKVLAPHLAHNPRARKRFIREAQAIAAVTHEHVIAIHGIDEAEEQPRIVMQFISGQSLQQKINNEGALHLKEILRIGMQTASGLSAAHAQGLVHRDVKPSNILLENGIERVKLTDFGLARAVDDASLTQSGVIAGTPQYMAPEQANGDVVDHRADLFSLGSVMYAMSVGHSPFRASTTMGVLNRVCNDPPRPIQELNPEIPDWLSNIIMKLLAKRPEDRYQSSREVAELLERWLAYVQQPTAIEKPPMPVAPIHQAARNASADQKQASGEAQPPAWNFSRLNWNPISAVPITVAVLFGLLFALPGLQRAISQLNFFGLIFVAFFLILAITALITALESRQTPGNSQIPATGNLEHFAARYKQVLHWELSFLQQTWNWLLARLQDLGKGLKKMSPFQNRERNHFMLVIGWLIACSLDLFTLISCIAFAEMIQPHPAHAARMYEFLFLGSIISGINGILAATAACALYWGRFLPLVGLIAFLGILPIVPSFFLRIPLSIVTLFWLHKVRKLHATSLDSSKQV